MLEVGDAAPDFELPATGGAPIRLSEAVKRNRATVIAFYVLDFTPG
jgi:peroxiredoxin